MRIGIPLLAAMALLTLTACGPQLEPEDTAAPELEQSTAELNTCSNNCTGYGGQTISCTGNTCSAASNYVVCDGVYTYCQPPPSPCDNFFVNCPYGGTVRCPAGTQSCYEQTSCSIVCDGAVRRCWLPAGQQCTA